MNVDNWKSLIIKRLLELGSCTNDELFKTFAKHFDTNTQKAHDELCASEIIMTNTLEGKVVYTINPNKISYIKNILDMHTKNDRDELQLSEEDQEGLVLKFSKVPDQKRENRGIYYHLVKKSDENYWKSIIKTTGDKKYIIDLGSIIDTNSRIMKIWKAVCKISKSVDHVPFFRIDVEKLDQDSCGNNRLPSKSAFEIFEYLGWLKNQKHGNRLKYKIIKNYVDYE